MDGSATEHIPVLADVLVEQIKLPQDAVVVDSTIGQGGHSLLFGKRLGPKGAIIGLDVDTKRFFFCIVAECFKFEAVE